MSKPRILLLPDKRNWAFDFNARAITRILGDQYDFETLFIADEPEIDDSKYDIIQIFYGLEKYHLPFLRGNAKILKCVRSHYWEIDKELDAMSCYKRYLKEAHAVCVTSRKLLAKLSGIPVPVFLGSSGVDTQLFAPREKRTGPVVVGWAGKPDGSMKQMDKLQKACAGICTLKLAPGNVSFEKMVDFYNSIDVIVTASIAEGDPRPILEGMSCGNFPVAFPVGNTTEVIVDGVNGRLVEQDNFDELRTTLHWCVNNPDIVRSMAHVNHELIRSKRDWEVTVRNYIDVYSYLLSS